MDIISTRIPLLEDQNASLKREISEKNQEISNLRSELSEVNQENARMVTQQAEILKENVNLKNDNHLTHTDKSRWLEKERLFDTEVATLKGKIEDLEKRLKFEQTESAGKIQRIQQLESSVRVHETKRNELNTKISTLSQQLTQKVNKTIRNSCIFNSGKNCFSVLRKN